MLEQHLGYVSDRRRLERFKAAIARTVTPGDRVADLGCGTGILGLLCLKAGADHVYAIDSSEIISVARETFRRAGWLDKATFVPLESYQTELPEQVDLVICDHVGYFGFDYDILQLLNDARNRFLKTGGRVLPSGLSLQIAAVQSEDARKKCDAWLGSKVPHEFHWVQKHLVNKKHAVRLSDNNVLGDPTELSRLILGADYQSCLTWSTAVRVARDGVVHGLAGWFECELVDGISITNSPLSGSPIDRAQAFFPIERPVPVQAGDMIQVTLVARPDDQLIAWNLRFGSSGEHFSHSTWDGLILSPEDLKRYQPDRIPTLSHEGAARLTVLGYCDGQRTTQQIIDAVLSEHPDRKSVV